MFRLLAIKITLITLVALLYIPVLFLAMFVSKKHRGYFWRVWAIFIIRTSFLSGGIRVRQEKNNFEDGPTIYVANHPSEMDGFLLQLFLGPQVIPMTAPLEQFPYLIALWLYRMEAVDVVRDDIDHARYKKGHTKEQALHRSLQLLQQGHSLLIFPEGHTELIEALYRFHTGAVRVSYASGAPLQTVIVKDAHRVFSDSFKKTSGVVTIVFGKRFIPEEIYGESLLFTQDEHLRTMVRNVTKSLEDEILNHLPVRALSKQREEANDVGVFVDIDLTIYRSLSQIDFLVDLTRRGHIPYTETLAVFFLFFAEKVHLISHGLLVQRAIRLLSGWKVETVDHLMRKFFRDLAIPKIEYGLFAIIEDHLAKGHHVVFVSEVMHPVAKAFVDFFEADKAIDTSLKKRGLTYTGEISFLCRGDNKALAVTEFMKEKNIIAQKSYAYADSVTDIPFLMLVGHPMAVNPDKGLQRYAKKHNVPILKKHP